MFESPAVSAGGTATLGIAGFIRYLAAHEFDVGHNETILALRMFSEQTPPALSLARLKLRILLCRDQQQWNSFGFLFNAYWTTADQRATIFEPLTQPVEHNPAPERDNWEPKLVESTGSGAAALEDDGDDEQQADAEAPEQQDQPDAEKEYQLQDSDELVASDDEHYARVDLRHVVEPHEIRAAEIQARRIATAIRYRLARRYSASARGKRPDLRKTIRASLAHGGDPLRLVRQQRPLRPVRLVLFLDVSGSMQHYSRFFLQFIKGLVHQWIDTDAYIFHTRLIRVTNALREKDAMTAMIRLSEKADGFGGGTNLGNSLRSFNREYAKSSINSRTAAFIFSDGYDSGKIERLDEELAQLKRRVRKLIWLNPLLGWENYAPVNGAMRTARQHLDVFAAANTLASLAEIEPLLEKL